MNWGTSQVGQPTWSERLQWEVETAAVEQPPRISSLRLTCQSTSSFHPFPLYSLGFRLHSNLFPKTTLSHITTFSMFMFRQPVALLASSQPGYFQRPPWYFRHGQIWGWNGAAEGFFGKEKRRGRVVGRAKNGTLCRASWPSQPGSGANSSTRLQSPQLIIWLDIFARIFWA